MRMTHNFCTILHLLVFPVSSEALKSFRKADADEGHMLVLQNRQSVGQTCTATCRNNSMTCDFKGIEDIPQQDFDKMLKQLLSGYICSGNSPLSNSKKYKFHNSTNEPSFNFRNQCASRYKDIGGKKVLPLCDSIISDPNVGRICRCKFKVTLPTSVEASPPTTTAAETSDETDKSVDKSASASASASPVDNSGAWVVPAMVLVAIVVVTAIVTALVCRERRKIGGQKTTRASVRSLKPVVNEKKLSIASKKSDNIT